MKEISASQSGASYTVPRETIPVRIREAVPEDAPELYRVISEAMELYRIASGIPCGKLDAGLETVGDVREAIASVPVFVAVLPDGSIAGSVRLIGKRAGELADPGLYAKLSLGSDSNVGYFSRFAVHEDLQGLGIGSLLYRAAEERAKDLHYSHLLLNTSLANRTMVSFYERRGFVLMDTDLSKGYPRGLFCKRIA